MDSVSSCSFCSAYLNLDGGMMMVDLKHKKLGKLIGLKKSDFNDFIKLKEITLRKPRLIPIYKLGDEMALTSVLLSSLRLVKEFKNSILSDAKMQIGGTVYVYTEVEFKDHPDCRIDGLILVVKSGEIRDAAIIEVKNGKNELDKDQIERYQKVAKQYSIPKFITISNQFVSDSKQSPVNAKNVSGVEMHHFSWTYLLTIAHVLLFENEIMIEDADQVEIMREVLNYLEWDKSGVVGLNQMKAGWVDVVEKINAGENVKATDNNVYEATLSWQQEERNMSLLLSQKLGVLVQSGVAKFKGKLEERLKSDCKELVNDKQLESKLRVRGAASDITILALFEKRTVEMSVLLKSPTDKTLKGQIGWLKRQLDTCIKKNERLLTEIADEIYIEVLFKKSPAIERFSIEKIVDASDLLKGKEIREFRIIYLKDFGKKFSSPRKFVEIIEKMLKDYYMGVVQHLNKWEPSAPKMAHKDEAVENESFIDAVNDGDAVPDESALDDDLSNESAELSVDKVE